MPGLQCTGRGLCELYTALHCHMHVEYIISVKQSCKVFNLSVPYHRKREHLVHSLMSIEQDNINSAERALENVVQHEHYLLWYDSTPAGKARRQHCSSPHKKTKLDGAHTTQNMVGNTTILPDQKHSASIKNTLPLVPFSNTNIASQQQQGRISKFQSKAPAPASTQEMAMAKHSFGLTASITPVKMRATCTKDRHSKVRTAKGLRDRRVRLSAPTAVRFFDVQDRLGYDQPSKAMDWLIKKAQAAIEDLGPGKPINLVGDESSRDLGTGIEEINSYQDADEQYEKEGQQSNRDVTTSSPMSSTLAISRARARARDTPKTKSNRDNMVLTTAQISALPPGLTSPAFSMLPETLLSQFLQPTSEPVASHLIHPPQPYNLSSDAESATSHIMPPPAHCFHIPQKPNASFLFHEFPETLSYDTNNNTLNSLGGTLQSIFIDSVTSQVPAMESYDMMGPHGSTYKAAGTGGNQSSGVLASGSMHPTKQPQRGVSQNAPYSSLSDC